MRKDPYKKKKIEDLIHKILSSYLRKGVLNPAFTLATITKVEVNKDLSIAKIYWDNFEADKREGLAKLFEDNRPRIRKYLAKELNTRVTPQLHFYYDNQFDSEENITRILEDEKKNIPSDS